MRAIVIDAATRSVKEVYLPPNGGSKEWHKMMQELLATDILECVGLGGPVKLWVDEEGLLKPTPGPFFRIGKAGTYSPIISKHGVLLEADEIGEPTGFKYSLKFTTPLIEFLSESWKFKEIRTDESVVEHPVLGKVSSIVQRSIFEDEHGNEHCQ